MNDNDHFILDENHQPVPTDLMTWARWLGSDIHKRRVDYTEFEGGRVSTVFLGLDHSFGSGPPLLFETMIFGGEHDEYCDRYTTWDEAVAGHVKAVALATGAK